MNALIFSFYEKLRNKYRNHAKYDTASHIEDRHFGLTRLDQLTRFQRKGGKSRKTATDSDLKKQDPARIDVGIFGDKTGNTPDHKRADHIDPKCMEGKPMRFQWDLAP